MSRRFRENAREPRRMRRVRRRGVCDATERAGARVSSRPQVVVLALAIGTQSHSATRELSGRRVPVWSLSQLSLTRAPRVGRLVVQVSGVRSGQVGGQPRESATRRARESASARPDRPTRASERASERGLSVGLSGGRSGKRAGFVRARERASERERERASERESERTSRTTANGRSVGRSACRAGGHDEGTTRENNGRTER